MKKRQQKKSLAYLTRNKPRARPVLLLHKHTAPSAVVRVVSGKDVYWRVSASTDSSLASLEAWQADFLIEPAATE